MNKGHARRELVSAAGRVGLSRLYLVCHACGDTRYPLDDRLGVAGFLSPLAARLACLAGVSWSFDKASDHLAEFCGLRLSDSVIRDACHSHAGAMAGFRESPEAAKAFARAAGDWEFQTDGTSANTTGGWREVKIGIFAKRERGGPATPADWASRDLPRPAARWAFAAIADCDGFSAGWRETAARLGLSDPSSLCVIADGAPWIWRAAGTQFPGSSGLLDIYHACEHLAGVSRAAFGEGTAGSASWLDAARGRLLGDGWQGWCEVAGALLASDGRDSVREACESATGYLSNHTEHLGYFKRLTRGQSIGSGMVEGACKQVIGRRLKQTGARWVAGRLNRMAELCCACYSDCWDSYWLTVAA
ncbi:MAG: hypothetical protein ACRC33_28860 [Gemmataceae bacterium]